MKQRPAFTLMEVMVATTIFTFVGLTMTSVYLAANRNVLQNLRSDKLKSDLSSAMQAISVVMAQATSIVTPNEGSSGYNLVVMSNVESGNSSPCCPMVPASYGAPAPQWHRFCVDTSQRLWYYSGTVGSCGGCPNLTRYSITAAGSDNNCGVAGNGRMLLATNINRAVPAFSRERQPSGSLQKRTANAAHTRLIDNRQTINVFLNTVWNLNNSVNASQAPVDYTLESYFTVMQPR